MNSRPDGFQVPADDPRGPNCGLTAIAIVTGKPYNDVAEAYRSLFKPRRNWNGATHHWQRVALLASLGVNMSVITLSKRRKVLTWTRTAKAGVTYMFRHSGHVCVYRDDWIVDQAGPVRVVYYRYRNNFVSHVIQISGERAS